MPPRQQITLPFTPRDWQRPLIADPAKRIVAGVRKQIPDAKIIGFPRGASGMLPAYVEQTEPSSAEPADVPLTEPVPPATLSTPTSPCIVRQSCLQIASPRPVPPYFRDTDVSDCVNGSNSED